MLWKCVLAGVALLTFALFSSEEESFASHDAVCSQPAQSSSHGHSHGHVRAGWGFPLISGVQSRRSRRIERRQARRHCSTGRVVLEVAEETLPSGCSGPSLCSGQ